MAAPDINMEVKDPDQVRAPISGDSGPGTALKDLLPLPSDTDPVTDPYKTETSATLHDDPTLSHALATDDHDIKGLAQQDHDHEVLDLGWNEKKQNIMRPLVGGMENETLWMLVRRFDKQMYHVKATPFSPPGGLDLNIADDEEFSPDKLRTSIERFYMNIVVGILGAVNHIARLRSWREKRRTAGFCAAYFIAWAFDFLVPLLIATLIALITYPPSRAFLFPPAPIALVDKSTGGVQKPAAGVLGSHDSATGAPENHKGEAVEKEASNFVDGIASVAVSSATAAGDIPNQTDKQDRTKKPLETVMWSKMKPLSHAMNDVIDTWERFANALSPISPFPENTYRLRLAGLVAPLFFVSLFVTSYMFVKGATFGIGFGFFGDPIISRSMNWLNRAYPNWQKLLELRNTILKGVPTNAQLTLTLLRIGEAHNAPLPPPPRIDEPPPQQPAQLTAADLKATADGHPLNATDAEIHEAIRNDPYAEVTRTGDADIDAAREPATGPVKGKRFPRAIDFFRGVARGAVKTAVGADRVRAKTTGAHAAKDRLGAIPADGERPVSGPVEFKARYEGKRGHVYLTKKATIPSIGFSVKESKEGIAGLDEKEQVDPEWSVAVADIAELKKVGGYGWKAKLVVGWSLGKEINDGLEIVTTRGGRYKVTAMPLRDELFNRLIAMGGQKWEAW
ncbi:hypothetical protein CONLIGDRAFT_663037 [Coniochaeta ligniaria NRRL 30616]|uniref:Uncharacterized protein n=1 Tax=Coniochaeta ligniaria NRRL 30616 TaxID=1408157 RepID=A0A1J7IHC6_9PEZI|nr:hypothetical protein CONLIGDRAFT_663037 [Coniochaeta ligniaria NRRL 30616]